jgi:hypothetical protein
MGVGEICTLKMWLANRKNTQRPNVSLTVFVAASMGESVGGMAAKANPYGERQHEHRALHVHVRARLPSLWADFSTRHRKFYAGTGYESKFALGTKKFMLKNGDLHELISCHVEFHARIWIQTHININTKAHISITSSQDKYIAPSHHHIISAHNNSTKHT